METVRRHERVEMTGIDAAGFDDYRSDVADDPISDGRREVRNLSDSGIVATNPHHQACTAAFLQRMPIRKHRKDAIRGPGSFEAVS
jgi:hypothetical protein